MLSTSQRSTSDLQIADAILAGLHEFNRQYPDEKPITADDEPWILRVSQQREELPAVLGRVEERLRDMQT